MRVGLRGLADLTNVNAMLLPEFGPNLPGPTQYVGGLSGRLGATAVVGPTTAAAMGTSSTSPSPTAVLGAQTLAAMGTSSTTSTPATSAAASCYAAGGTPTSTGGCTYGATFNTSTMLMIGGGALALILLLALAKKK